MKSVIRFTMAVALLAPIGVLTAIPAGAAGGTSCAVQAGKATIKPGISTKKQNITITVTSTLSKCTGGGVTGGTVKATLTSKLADCSGLAKIGTKMPVTETVTWNTKKTSTVKGSIATGPKVLQATETASVSTGLFAGSKVSNVVIYALGAGQNCTKVPVTLLTLKNVKPFVIK